MMISFICNLKSKLREKYSSTALGLKKLADQYPYEIPILQFRNLLRDMKLKYTEKEFKEFFKIYGKTQKSTGFMGITIESLTKCIHSSPVSVKNPSPTSKMKKLTLMKTQNFSTRASSKVLEDSNSRLNMTLANSKLEFNLNVKNTEANDFLNNLIQVFHTPEEVVEFFFVDREDSLRFEVFLESVKFLQLDKQYLDLSTIFLEISCCDEMTRESLYWKLFNLICKQEEEEIKPIFIFRDKLHQMFENYFKAFQELSSGNTFISTSALDNLMKNMGIVNEKQEILLYFQQNYPGNKLFFKDFKSFWVGKEGICSVKSCEEEITESFSYCKNHIQTLTNRGEEIYTKLQMVLKKTQLMNLVQDVMKEEKLKILVVNGFELHKKDALALKEFLKAHGFVKRPASNSVKSRV